MSIWKIYGALAALVLMAGIWANGLLRQSLWAPNGLRALAAFSAAYWALALLGPRHVRIVAIALATVWSIASVGPLPVAATVLLLIASYGIGCRLAAGPVAIAAGLAAYAVVTGILAHFPINTAPLYWVLLSIGLLMAAGRFQLPSGAPSSVAESLAIYLASIHLLAGLFPETGSDGLGIHLTIPAWVANHGKWEFEATHFSWALMPMSGDWAFTFAYLAGGGEAAARLLNVSLLVLTALVVYRLARQFAGTESSILAAALYLSTPVTYLVSGSLFVESFWTLMLCAALALIVEYHERGEAKHLCLAGTLVGAALSAKLLAVAFALPLAVAAAWRRRAPGVATASAVLASVVGLPPYIQAWLETGNPVFPLFNAVFRSPLFSTVLPFADARYPPALTWNFLWTATFQSSKLLDGYNGGFGFHYLLLLPAAVSLLRHSPWLARVCLLVGLTGGAVILAQMGYLRYILPALALLCAGFAFAIERVGRPAIILLVLLNVYFFPAASSYTNDFWLAQSRENFLERVAPIRILIDFLNREAPGEPVAFLEDDQVAGLIGQPYGVSWRTWPFQQALVEAATPGAALQVFASRGIRRAIAPAPGAWYASQYASAQGLLQVCGEVSSEARDFAAWRIRTDCTSPEQADRAYFDDTSPAPAGEYDDVGPFLRYRGHWVHDRQFADAMGHTLTYTSTPGDFVQLRFRGRWVRFFYTAAPNRGVGDVSIDGRSVGRLDQHSPQTVWGREASFEAAASGDHLLRVSLSPDKPGAYLDVDRMAVE